MQSEMDLVYSSDEEEYNVLRIKTLRNRELEALEDCEDHASSISSIMSDDEETKSIPLNNEVTNYEVPPLSVGEINTIRETIRWMGRKHIKEGMSMFRVPKEHPVFDGVAENLEPFILEMQLSHVDETNAKMGKMHRPDFITKLIPYFSSGARTWFRMYATGRIENHQKLTWERLRRDMRSNFAKPEQHSSYFDIYYNMRQETDVQTYIAKKAEAALLSNDLNDNLLLRGFIRGLKSNIRDYVWLQNPKDIDSARAYAIAFENSMGKDGINGFVPQEKKRIASKSEKMGPPFKKQKPSPEESLDKNKMNALSKLRELRSKKCFTCGITGHQRENCKTSEDIKIKHQEEIRRLKKILQGT